MNLGDWFEEDTSTESIARDCSYPGAGYAQVCGHEVESHVESWPWMKTLLDVRARKELVERLTKLRPDAQPIWGRMSAHQMVCHLSDSLRAALGEKHISRSTSLFKRVILKRLALWAPIPWPHGFKTRPEMDQEQGGTPPVEFASDLEEFRTLLGCLGKCRRPSACATPISTSIITCGSSRYRAGTQMSGSEPR